MQAKQTKNVLRRLYNEFRYFILDLMIFDLWISWKCHELFTVLGRIFIPTIRALLFASLGFGSVVAFTLVSSHFDRLRSSNLMSIKPADSIGITYLPHEQKHKNIATELFQERTRREYLEKLVYEMHLEVKTKLQLDNIKQKVNLPDFASDAAGGSVISTPGTEPYVTYSYVSFYGVSVWKIAVNNSPRKIVQPWTEAGDCWPFKGDHGKIEIKLAYEIEIDSVTVEHIPKDMSLTGNINSAPKDFKVYGYFEDKYELFGYFIYDCDGSPSQSFVIENIKSKTVPIRKVLLEVISNWGNPEYTCIYRFKVHGKIFENSGDIQLADQNQKLFFY